MNIIESNLSFNGALTYANNPGNIVLHHAEASSCTVQDIHAWHLANGWIGIGYHFFIRKDGSIYRGRPEGAVGAHCPQYNSISLGVCFEGDFMTETITAAQTSTYKQLVKYIRAKYGDVPIYGHGELYSTSCPGTNFPLSDFKAVQVNNTYTPGWNENQIVWYYLTNTLGWYYKDCWQYIDGSWYSFDADGYARKVTWLKDGYWYYLKDSCKMSKSEWLWIDGECYCFNMHGELYVGTTTPDGYKVDDSGAWIQ